MSLLNSEIRSRHLFLFIFFIIAITVVSWLSLSDFGRCLSDQQSSAYAYAYFDAWMLRKFEESVKEVSIVKHPMDTMGPVQQQSWPCSQLFPSPFHSCHLWQTKSSESNCPSHVEWVGKREDRNSGKEDRFPVSLQRLKFAGFHIVFNCFSLVMLFAPSPGPLPSLPAAFPASFESFPFPSLPSNIRLFLHRLYIYTFHNKSCFINCISLHLQSFDWPYSLYILDRPISTPTKAT